MHELFADRFLSTGNSWLDLASGARVRLRVAPAGDRRSQTAWDDECAELARLRHPALNPLVDFGLADRERTFEAYAVSVPPRGPIQSRDAACFLEARRVSLTPARAPFVVREPSTSAQSRRRTLGVVLQPRVVHRFLAESLAEAGSGGMLTLDVLGREGSGLRTLRVLTARTARIEGYLPIDGGLLIRTPSLTEAVADRHLCVLVDDRLSTAERLGVGSLLLSLGIRSTRRHVVVTFTRRPRMRSRPLEIEPMSVSALMSMVFATGGSGPGHDVLLRAAREADGRPGAFLARLRAVHFSDHAGRVAMVQESSAVYTCTPRGVNVNGFPAGRLRQLLLAAPARASRLASRGRHASARRLLVRAARVLEARDDRLLAAACAELTAWLDRNRGRLDEAIEGFARTKALAGDSAGSIAAAIGLGVCWTDVRRFPEAEAALRGACAAAEILAAPDLQARAAIALARCLYWQGKYGDAAVVLAPYTRDPSRQPPEVEAWAWRARLDAARNDLRSAVRAAVLAAERAEQLNDLRLRTVAARTMATIQLALGDHLQARDWVERGRRAAAAAHLPLAGLRFRALAIATARAGSIAGVGERDRVERLERSLSRCALPALLRFEVADILARAKELQPAGPPGERRSLSELQQLLELVQAGQDDQTALAELCRTLAERLRAATVQVVVGAPEPRTLARAGRPWQGETQVIERVLAGGSALTCDAFAMPQIAAHAIRYGQEPIGVLCCRWTVGLAAEARRADDLLHAGALAAAAPVRNVLDRAHPMPTDRVCGDLIGASPAAVQLRDAIARAARAPFPVLLEGESGSGKELVARGIHRLGARRDRRLCTVNCAALADDLLEAELFGHARGAFTGAIGERAGLFEEADGGTLFLDEVGELSGRAQAKLLRVLQDGEVRRVGENLPRRIDARIVAATNRRLAEEVAAGRFRADLRFRLDVIRIDVPPLRERATDIPALAGHFWTEATTRLGSAATLAPETLAALARYDWPGNVRELQNAIASLAVHAPRRGRVTPSMLPEHIARSSVRSAASFEAARQEFERRYVRAALVQSGGHRARAARSLGVSRQGLAKMMRRLRIDDEGT